MGIMENKKESELKVVERLLDSFEVKEGILTLDALHTQKTIENALHWTKDVTMKEDECGIRKNKPAGTLGILRNVAFNLLKLTGIKSIKKAMEKMLYNLEQIWKMINLPVCFFKSLSIT
jgi:predicted transposase YbfD/YdcC